MVGHLLKLRLEIIARMCHSLRLLPFATTVKIVLILQYQLLSQKFCFIKSQLSQLIILIIYFFQSPPAVLSAQY